MIESDFVHWKDLLLQAGVVVTLVLGLVNLYYNLWVAKRTSFINTVTTERVKWISKVRENVSLLCSLCDQWTLHPTATNTVEYQERMEKIKIEIRLQLNPNDTEDKAIEAILDRLPSWSNGMGRPQYVAIQAELVKATQQMLKREWEKVKDEAIKGDLREKEPVF